MADGETLDNWIGKQGSLSVLHDGTVPRRFYCTLKGVDQMGLIAHYDTKKAPDQTRFFPWRCVLYVHLVKPEDAPPRVGFS